MRIAMSLWYNKRMTQKAVKGGFTLVELSLSIVFIAILSLTIVFIINNAIATYRRGLTLNQVNTIGMDLVDDFRVTVQNSSPVTLSKLCTERYKRGCNNDDEKEGASMMIVNRRFAQTKLGGGNNTPVSGMFCTGGYSYIWNSGYFMSENIADSGMEPLSFKYRRKNGDDEVIEETKENFRLLKIKDEKRSVCKYAIGKNDKESYKRDGIIDMTDVSDMADVPYGDALFDDDVIFNGEAMELLSADEQSAGLALYDLYSSAPATNTLGTVSLYSVSFVLGTVQGGANIRAAGDFCKASAEADGNFDYCAINKFNFAAQANGG